MAKDKKNYHDKINDFVEDLGEDHSEATSGGGGWTPPAAGRGTARMVHYIELGDHFQKFEGVLKDDPDPLVRIVFELFGKAWPARKRDDGTEYPVTYSVTLTKSTSTRSKFFKLFSILNEAHGKKYKHMAQMAADNVAMNFEIKHNVVGEGKNKRTFANVWHGGNWLIGAAEREDEDGEIIAKDVPEAQSDTLVFLFERPDADDWNALFIDGKNDDGTSRNRIQERIVNAVNYPGSALEALLGELPEQTDEGVEEEDVNPAPKQSKPAKSTGKASKLGEI